jgi:hypothetical protein
MEAQHLAIDGSVVTIRSEAELRPGPVTGTGWATVPSLMRAHPFTTYPAGHSRTMEQAVRENFPDVELEEEEELDLKGGTLHVGRVAVPRDGGPHRFAIAAWEGRHGCLTTTLPGDRGRELAEVFDSLQFRDQPRGLAIDSPVVTVPRPPQLMQEVAGLGLLAIRPAIGSELEVLPRAEGRRTRHGELFRMRADGRAMLLLGRNATVRIQPREDAADEELAEAIEGLDVEWVPRASRRPPR